MLIPLKGPEQMTFVLAVLSSVLGLCVLAGWLSSRGTLTGKTGGDDDEFVGAGVGWVGDWVPVGEIPEADWDGAGPDTLELVAVELVAVDDESEPVAAGDGSEPVKAGEILPV